jgi:cytochrome c biogenesis factor
MAFEISFLVAAALLFFVDLALLSMPKAGDKLKITVGLVAAVTAFWIVITSYALLLQAFAINDFQLVGVYSYSSTSSSLLSQVYASWAGAGGSMLFLTVLLSVVYLSLRLLAFKKRDNFHISACQVFSFVLIVFIIVCLVRNPFERFVDVPAEGRGLNPQLQTLWMVIHPPIVFGAYAFVVLAFTLALATMKTGREIGEVKLLRSSIYMAWLLLTLGIALGGVWAYEVLGWGGYWAWDPVETASLVPWLLLTAYFFVEPLSKKKSLTRELILLATFASLIFLSALTRGGFTSSVHSYTVSAVGPVMLSFAFGFILYFFYLHRKNRQPLFKIDVEKTSLTSRASFFGFWTLISIAIVCLAGLGIQGFSYNTWTFPFVFAFLLALVGCSLNEKTLIARMILIALVAILAGLALAQIQFPTINTLALLALPLMVMAFSTTLHKLLKTTKQKAPQNLAKKLLYFSFVILLIGVFVSSGAKTTNTITELKPDMAVEVLPIKLELSNIKNSSSSSRVLDTKSNSVISEYSSLSVDASIQYLGRVYQGTLEARYYPNYGLTITPLIISTETGDVYVHLDYSEPIYNYLTQVKGENSALPESLNVIVQHNPAIYLLWIGIALVLLSIFLLFLFDLLQKRRSSLS